jgi:cystathionine gamma-synthase
MSLRPETAAVVAGRGEGGPGDPVNPPVVLSSTYHAEGERTYGRDDNPTWEAFEEAVGALEGGRAVCFASGLAAIAAVVETVPAGAVVVAERASYSGTRRLLADLGSRGRLEGRLVDTTDVDATLDALPGAALLWLESPSNPLCQVADLAALCAGARRAGVAVAVDNTVATPLRQRPLDLGADVVVHSATKQLSGHSDVLMGVIATRDDQWVERLRARRSLHGAAPGPMEVYLALRGVRTLHVRLERAEANAEELARRLGEHPAVERVRWPGFGWLLSFELASQEAADKLCAAVRLIVHATSLGGVETLIERRGRWAMETYLPPSLVRLSVGIEHVEDLWADLAQALE